MENTAPMHTPVEGSAAEARTNLDMPRTSLLDLPGELRNHISEMAMQDHTGANQFSILSDTSKSLTAPIARVNRQLRQEYLSTIYSRTIILFHMKRPTAELQDFIDRLSAEGIRHVTKYTFGNLPCDYDKTGEPHWNCQSRNSITLRLENKVQPVPRIASFTARPHCIL